MAMGDLGLEKMGWWPCLFVRELGEAQCQMSCLLTSAKFSLPQAVEKEAAKPKLVSRCTDGQFANEGIAASAMRRSRQDRTRALSNAGQPASAAPSTADEAEAAVRRLRGAVDISRIVADAEREAHEWRKGASSGDEELAPPPGMEDLPPLE